MKTLTVHIYNCTAHGGDASIAPPSTGTPLKSTKWFRIFYNKKRKNIKMLDFVFKINGQLK